jgi:hypothetical protein
MKKKFFGFAGAIIISGWCGLAVAGNGYLFVPAPVIFVGGGSTNMADFTLPRLDTWRVYPAEASELPVASPPGTNTVTMVDNTNAPMATPPPPPPAPPPPGSVDPVPNTIQSTPSLQGSQPGSGPQ